MQIDLLHALRFRLSSLVGTLPAGGFFCAVKRNQNPLRAFPPKDLPGVRVWPCVKPTVGPGPGGVTWMVWQVYGPCPLLCETASLLPGPYPGVRRSRRRQVSTRPKSLPCVKGGGPALAGSEGLTGQSTLSFSHSRYLAQTTPQSAYADSSPYTGEPLALSHSSRQSSHSRSPAPLSGDWAESRPPRSTPSPHPQCGTPSPCPG